MKTIPCGCSKCGCVCADHSATGVERLCAKHGSLVLTIFGDALALTSLFLFLATAFVWCSILTKALPPA